MSRYTRQKVGCFSGLPDGWLPADPVAFLDIETTGLDPDHAHVTLVGVAWEERGVRWLEQFFVDEPKDEEDLLRAVANRLRRFSGLVTYNGHFFDLRFLRVRTSTLGVGWPNLEHLDLLHVAREWQRNHNLLPDCRLQTVMAFFRLGRTDHTSGHEMVQAYQRWLKTRDPVHRDLILEHNAQDLMLLPDLMIHLLQAQVQGRRAGS
ncbi:MAG: ribonuclease H-like domain-containing protein [Bacillota bacterium]